MNLLLDQLFSASLLALLSLLLLAALRHSPARLRLIVVLAGLVAWLVPWPMVTWSVAWPFGATDMLAVTAGSFLSNAGANLTRDLPLATEAAPGAFWIWLTIAPGALLLVIGLFRHYREIHALICNSDDDESLRRLLPPSLHSTPQSIRVVRNSTIAAASGWWRGTLWVGDRWLGHQNLPAVLTHEALHLRRRDALTLASMALVRCLYWWNPLVVWQIRKARALLETACDEDCSNMLGRRNYQHALARLLLAAQPMCTSNLLPALRSRHDDLARIRHLDVEHRNGSAGWLALLLMLGGFSIVPAMAAQLADPRLGYWIEQKSSTDYQGLHRSFTRMEGGKVRMVLSPNHSFNIWTVDFRCDGSTYPVFDENNKRVGDGDTYGCTPNGTGQVKFFWMASGVTRRGTETVSADGVRYTVEIEELDNSGNVVKRSHRDFLRKRN